MGWFPLAIRHPLDSPSEPQEDRPEHDEDRAVPGHLDGVPLAIEPSDAGSDHDRPHHAGKASDHVHNGAAGEINHARAKEEVLATSGGATGVERESSVDRVE